MDSFIKIFKKKIKSCECDYECNAIRFKQNFNNWTSGNNDINKFIQNTQLSDHNHYWVGNALEWIPYDRLYDVKYIAEDDEFGKVYRANWIDGCMNEWNDENWERKGQNMFVILKILKNPSSITLEFINKLNDICEKCNKVCNSIHFQRNFQNWTSGSNDINKFIQDTQLSVHDDARKLLEWIPYNRLYDVKYIAGDDDFGCKVYRANWIDGCIINDDYRFWEYDSSWDNKNQNWIRNDQNMFVILKILNNPASITSKYIDKIAKSHIVYGITQDPETKNYMVVLNDICEKCNKVCENALEWIPYDRLYDVKCIAEDDEFGKAHRANWIDGCMNERNDENWERKGQNMFVILKILNNPSSITLEFVEFKKKSLWITQDPETKNYMVVLNDICEKCNVTCISIRFQQNSQNCFSGNNDIDKFIHTQLSHTAYSIKWIPYDRFDDIEFIAKGGFGLVYRANWIMEGVVALKTLNDSKNITLEFLNEIILHHKINYSHNIIKFYGITQDPKTKNYIMILEYAKNGSLRTCLNTNYNKIGWMYITDMGLCRPASENIKNNVYGVLCYMALETLQKHNYTKASDIYSFGIIMYEVICGLPPYHDVCHDNILAIRICQGLRPRFNIIVPQLIVNLIKRCLDANQLNRPTAKEIKEILAQWCCEVFNNQTELGKQIIEAEEINNNLPVNSTPSISLGLSYTMHSKAIYTSKLLNFNNLSKPKNTDDYYEQNDNIISLKSLASLQIDISKLNINDLLKPKNPDVRYDNMISMESSAESLQIDNLQLRIGAEPDNSDYSYEKNDDMIS
ncbi:kinase-like protein [Rhizophagus irregularis]|nr:kinase-like protein [Rhizophagus irregularis]